MQGKLKWHGSKQPHTPLMNKFSKCLGLSTYSCRPVESLGMWILWLQGIGMKPGMTRALVDAFLTLHSFDARVSRKTPGRVPTVPI